MNANQNNTRKIAIAVAIVAVLLCTVIAGILLLLNNHETRLADVETKVAELQQLIEDSQTLTDEEKTLANEDAELASDIAADDEDNYDEIIAIIDELKARIEAVEKARVSGNTSVVFDDSDIWDSIKNLQKEDEKIWAAIEELRELIKANAGNSNAGTDYSSVIADLQKQIDELKNNKPAIKDYQDQIDTLMAKIADLEAQISELKKNGNSNNGNSGNNSNSGNSNNVAEPENTQQGGQGGPADNGNDNGSNVPSEPTNCYEGGNNNSNGNNGYDEPEGFENGDTEGQVIDLRTGRNTNSNDAVEVGEPDIVIGEPTDVFQG